MSNPAIAAAAGNNVSIPNVLLKAFFRSRAGLNICHLNAGSVRPKIDLVRDVFENSGAHVVILGETWFKSYVSNKSVEISGYELLRNDRAMRRSGGIAAYVKVGINYKVVLKSINLKTEYLFFEVIFPNSKILVGAVYKAPDVDEIAELDDVLSELTSDYEDIILAGDFNQNLLSVSRGQCVDCVRIKCSNCRFYDVMCKYSLLSVGDSPTHYPPGRNPSQIDYFLTNSHHKVMFYNQISSGLSAHDILAMTYACELGDGRDRTKLIRKLDRIDRDELIRDALRADWQSVYGAESVDDVMVSFNSVLQRLLDRHSPEIMVPVAPKSVNSVKKWMTDDIRRAVIERDVSYSYYKLDPTDEKLEEYRVLRNRVTQLIRTAKFRFFKPWFDERLGCKRVWNNLRSLGIVSSKKDCVKPNFTASEYNSYLSTPVEDFSSVPLVTLPPTRPRVQLSDAIFSFSFRNVSQSEVSLSIMKVKSNAVGLDGIPISFVRMILPVLLPVVTYVFNQMLMRSVFPRLWKAAKVLPVHKRTTTFSLKDFRPISILPALSKAFEKLAKAQIVEYLDEHQLLNPCQSGFRANHSTTSALLKVTDDVLRGFERRKVTLLLLHDFTKAFDSVDHCLLRRKLVERFRFSKLAVKLVSSYLSDRVQCVQIEDGRSTFLPVRVGVPQGSVLGPLLFSMFINDLPDVLRHSRPHLFADDFQNYVQSLVDDSALAECVANLNEDLMSISSWAMRNKLLLNCSKLQAVLLSDRSASIVLNDVLMNGVKVEFASGVKNLGLRMSADFTWESQCNQIVSKVYAVLRSLSVNRSLIPVKARVGLVKSLLLPHFIYCDAVFFDGLTASDRKVLERAFNACLRFAFNLKKRQSVRGYEDKILGCGLMQYLSQHTLAFIHGLILRKAPGYLFSKVRMLRSSRTFGISVPLAVTRRAHDSLFVSGVARYNLLPVRVKRAGTMDTFRGLCHDHVRRGS